MKNTSTLIELVQVRADADADLELYMFRTDKLQQNMTCTVLLRRARAIGGYLQNLGLSGERIVLLCDPGLDTVAGFFGCIFAGAIAVPVPRPGRRNGSARLKAVMEDCGAAAVLDTHKDEYGRSLPRQLAQGSTVKNLLISEVPDEASRLWKDPGLHPSSIAFIQYTSGSTGSPKGVVVSHGNLLSNAAEMQEAFAIGRGDKGVFWLPLYHDMGLMGGAIQPVYSGYPTILMPPLSVIERPMQWLEMISAARATISGGPNFSYALCSQRAIHSPRADLDLTSWRVAFNGSETVRAETLQAFSSMFASCGFNPRAMRPCYGLAEATLLVSARNSSGGVTVHVEAEALKNGKVREWTAGTAPGRTLVAVGEPNPSHSVVIVNPDTLEECSGDEIGEIWVSGPSVAQGYWQKEEETIRVFHASLSPADNRRYLRTGDMGFLSSGQLFIAGRLKDLIIVRGQNFYPQDIEATVARCHPALQNGRGAAFSVLYGDIHKDRNDHDGSGDESGDGECLVVVHELSRSVRSDDAEPIIRSIRERVANEHQLHAHAVVLIRQGSMPKTTSGKVQHKACREAFLAGGLSAVITSVHLRIDANTQPVQVAIENGPTRRDGELISPTYQQVAEAVASALHIRMEDLAPDLQLTALGVDSLKASQVKIAIERTMGASVPLSALLQGLSIKDLASLVTKYADCRTPGEPLQAVRGGTAYPLSAGQKALWFLQQLEPQSSAYTIARAATIKGPLDLAVLESVFATLVRRHASLRMTVTGGLGEPAQDVSSTSGLPLHVHDARDWTEEALMEHLAGRAHEPFDLAKESVLRVHVYVRSRMEAVMLLCAHHIALDLWSLGTLIQELLIVYPSLKRGQIPDLQPLNHEYSGFVRWQSELLQGTERERLLDYWRRKLQNAPPAIALPAVRKQTVDHDSGLWHIDFDADLRSQLHAFTRVRQTTMHGVLQASFEVLLHRYTGQEEFLVGMLSSGRDRRHTTGVVGYFINPLVLRPNFRGNPAFDEYLQQSYSEVLEALDHGDLPFSTMVEQLPSLRHASRSPLLQVMCIFQPSRIDNGPDLASFIMGSAGGALEVDDLLFESSEFSETGVQFDLTLVACDTGKQIAIALRYDPRRFDATFIRRLGAHYQVMVRDAVLHPELRIGDLAMMTEPEIVQVTRTFNDTAAELRSDACIHTLFEEQVDLNPSNLALVHEGAHLTYRELDRLANQLANYLRGLGVRPEAKVGLYCERSLDLVVGMMGILKAGGAYVALDPSYPIERTRSVLQISQTALVVTAHHLARQFDDTNGVRCICFDRDHAAMALASDQRPARRAIPENLAYVMYTSGSTGRPKGVMIEHQNVINFFSGMNGKIACGPGDTLLAVTSISFDISILELLWTLTRGAKVVIANDASLNSLTIRKRPRTQAKDIQFSLFYFASGQTDDARGKYEMLLEGAKLADQLGLEAVWTPERHFHDFGGLYSNPSLTSAALAMITRRVHLRGGSVVLPLHHPVRVAEEWAFVDNISKGRVGVAFASGWHADDFVFAPQSYPSRKEVMYQGIETVRQLWRGNGHKTLGGGGNEVEVKIYPRPIQPELPLWITSAGSAETFQAAGHAHANVLTHLLGQEIADVAAKLNLYRQALEREGKDPSGGIVTLMLHTYLDKDFDQVRQRALGPFKTYLRSSLSLITNLVHSLKLNLDLEKMKEQDLDDLLAFAAERYMGTSGLFGTPESCLEMVDTVRGMGVDEIACLIDFGVDFSSTMQSIFHIAELQRMFNRATGNYVDSNKAQERHTATILQCTPSYMRMLMHKDAGRQMLGSLRTLLLGGEALPSALVAEVANTYRGPIFNMYGPTETTIWSAVRPISAEDGKIFIGGPIANTQLYVLTADMTPVPIGIVGELYIGGRGLARGYLESPALTAERFLPDPFSSALGARLYRTGDLGRLQEDGAIELAGRLDQQVKIRGYRIELGDIEASLNRAPGVGTGVVVDHHQGVGETQLVAYVVASNGSFDLDEVRNFLRTQLPPYMVPNKFHVVPELPLTANGKVDRKTLLAGKGTEDPASAMTTGVPTVGLQATVLEVWKQVLKLERISLDDNFFDIGGHSLLMVQTHEQLQRILTRSFPLMALLQHPTIRSIAMYLDSTGGGNAISSADAAAQQRVALLSLRQRALAARG